MKKAAHTTTAECAGRWLGRVWRGLVQQEARIVQWLGGKGLPAGVTQMLLGIVKIAVFGALLYAVFWLALLLLFAIAAAWMARNTDWEYQSRTARIRPRARSIRPLGSKGAARHYLRREETNFRPNRTSTERRVMRLGFRGSLSLSIARYLKRGDRAGAAT